jgi:predicted nucleic acid-binding protein
MKRLINDANIFIDLEEAGLTKQLFDLPYEFAVSDVLFEEELQAQHGDLLKLGLFTLELAHTRMLRVFDLQQRYSGIGFMDCFALALAEQELCPLLTGDNKLREAARAEGTEVHGTLWVIEEMLRQQIISIETAHRAYDRMELARRRLPFKEARRRLTTLFGKR